MKIWHVLEDDVHHYLVAEDEAQARWIMAKQLDACGQTTDETGSLVFRECPRNDPDMHVKWHNFDDNGESDGKRPALDIIDEVAAEGPGYVACSEW